MKIDYAAVWRWHFYAGLFFAPILLFLAMTGSIYLFDEEIDSVLHRDLHRVEARPDPVLPPAAQLDRVRSAFPGASIASFQPSFEPGESSRVGILEDGGVRTVFVDPYEGTVLGSVVNAATFTEVVRDLHEKFLAGKVGNWIVEASASWMVVLILTGLYLWWPRGKGVRGTFFPRLDRKGRTFWRDLHAVTGAWLALFLLFQGLTGLAWTDVWGDGVKKVAASVDAGFPPELPFNPPDVLPESTVPTGAVVENAPWAVENVPLPESKARGPRPISVEEVMGIAEANGVPPGYGISFPRGSRGVFTINASSGRPQNNATLHVDQYGGEVLTDLRFDDYGVVAQAISVGIMIHQGDYFGWPNKLLILLIAGGLILMIVSAVKMWWKRRPDGGFGAPTLPRDFKLLRRSAALLVLLGLLFPLFGATLLIALVLEYAVVRRIPALHERLR